MASNPPERNASIGRVLPFQQPADGENHRERADHADGGDRRLHARALVLHFDREILVEAPLDESGQLRQAPLHRAQIPVRPAEEHASGLEVVLEHAHFAQVADERVLERILVQRPHDRRAGAARHAAVTVIRVGPLTNLRVERDSSNRPRLQHVDRAALDGELDVLRRAEMPLDPPRGPFDVGTILPEQRMIGGKRRAMSREQRVAEAFAGLDHDFLRAGDRVDREGDAGQLRLDHALDDHVHPQGGGVDAAATAILSDRLGVHRVATLLDGLLHLRQRAKVQQRAELPGKRRGDAILTRGRGAYGEREPQGMHGGGQIRRRAIERRHREPGALQLEEHASLAGRRSRRRGAVKHERLHCASPLFHASCSRRAQSHGALPSPRAGTRAPPAGFR